MGDGAAAVSGPWLEGRDKIVLVSCDPVLKTPFGRAAARGGTAGAKSLAAVISLPDGEAGKTFRSIERAAGRLLKAGATRRSLVVALGGGAVTDAAGFLAATYMRGVDWVAVPTTLLGMVDAAIGGKTAAVNLPVAKNASGGLPPSARAVLCDTRTLHSLPRAELRSGFGETLKYACLDPALLERASAMAESATVDADFVAACAAMKIAVVSRDARERGERKLLNLGHTFGHAVEAAGKFSRYSHGEAVAVGLCFAFRLAARLGRVGADSVARVEEAVLAARLPARVPGRLARKARKRLGYDKKNDASGVRWVLPVSDGDRWRVEWDVLADEASVAATTAEVSEMER